MSLIIWQNRYLIFETALSRLTRILINIFFIIKRESCVTSCSQIACSTYLSFGPFPWHWHCFQSCSRLSQKAHYLGHQSKLGQKRNLRVSKAHHRLFWVASACGLGIAFLRLIGITTRFSLYGRRTSKGLTENSDGLSNNNATYHSFRKRHIWDCSGICIMWTQEQNGIAEGGDSF